MTKGEKDGDCQFGSVKNFIFSFLSYAGVCFSTVNVYFAGNITL